MTKNLTVKTGLIGLLFFLGSVASADPQLEHVLGNGFDQNGVFIQVFSGGCTDKDSFLKKIENQENLKILTF